MLYQSDIETLWDLVQKLLLDADVEVGGLTAQRSTAQRTGCKHSAPLGQLLLSIAIPQNHKQQRTRTVRITSTRTHASRCPDLCLLLSCCAVLCMSRRTKRRRQQCLQNYPM